MIKKKPAYQVVTNFLSYFIIVCQALVSANVCFQLQSEFCRKVSGKREKKKKEERKQQIAKYWKSQPSSRTQKIRFQILLQDSAEIPHIGNLLQFTGCSGIASLALVELMLITQRKINSIEQTVGDGHVCPIPLKSK